MERKQPWKMGWSRRGRSSGVSSLATGPHLAAFSEVIPARVGSSLSLGYLNLRASSSKISTSFSSSAGEDDVLARGKCVGAGFRSIDVREKNEVVSGRTGPRASRFTATCWGGPHGKGVGQPCAQGPHGQ